MPKTSEQKPEASDVSIQIDTAVTLEVEIPQSLHETLAEIADFRSMDVPQLLIELVAKDTMVQSRYTKASLRSWARNR